MSNPDRHFWINVILPLVTGLSRSFTPPLMQIENVPVFNFYKIYNLVPTFPELRVMKRLFEPLCKKQQFLPYTTQ
jgi:hypothetical protein